MNPALSLPPAPQTQLQLSDGRNRPEPTSPLFMGAASALPIAVNAIICRGRREKGKKKKRKREKTSDIEMSYKLVTVLLDMGSFHSL